LSVAVVVPCYNAANELGATLRALLAQTYNPDEIIVVDDGSTDDSAAIAESFGGTVRVVRQANAGAARARHRGVQEARSDLIVFNDAGDISTPDRIERLRSALLSHPECVAAYGVTWIKSRPEPKVWKRTGGPLDGSLTLVPDALNRCLAQNWPLAIGMNLAVRREVAMKSAQVPAFYKAANDYALQVRTASLGSFVHVAAVTLEYEETQGGISSQNGYIQQTGYALCAAAETLDSLDDCTGIDVEAFRKRVESWPGIALHMYLRGNRPLMRKVIGIGFRFGRMSKFPRRLWWALDSAEKEGSLERAPLLSAVVGALNRLRSTTR
jgi:glycosyltransferase involved in cell wall biosynthesis